MLSRLRQIMKRDSRYSFVSVVRLLRALNVSFLNVRIARKEENSALVEDAVKYIIFLVDADRLFDTALGMYDFSLVLLVAQYSQKVSSTQPSSYLYSL